MWREGSNPSACTMTKADFSVEEYLRSVDRDTVRLICRRLGLGIGRKDDMIRRVMRHRKSWQIMEAINGKTSTAIDTDLYRDRATRAQPLEVYSMLIECLDELDRLQ